MTNMKDIEDIEDLPKYEGKKLPKQMKKKPVKVIYKPKAKRQLKEL